MHDELHRPDRCTEALQLGRQLCEVLPREPESLGLLALMLLQDSRRDARIRDGQLITLEGQDRSLWDPIEISEGLGLVEAALRSGPVGPYQLQAAIAAVHAEAKTSAETDWRQIAALYEKLLEINPSSVIALNQAVAIAMADGHEAGLQQIDAIGSSGELDWLPTCFTRHARTCCGGWNASTKRQTRTGGRSPWPQTGPNGIS